MTGIDLFSGAGGLTEGILNQGYAFVSHIEKEKWACETLKTRLMYHQLKKIKKLSMYYEYYESKGSIDSGEKVIECIKKKYPDIFVDIDQEVQNVAFGEPDKDKNATSLYDIVSQIEKSSLLKQRNNVDLVIGGPPCQAYSLIGRARMKESIENDSRNYLFEYYQKIVSYFKPKILVFENVPGINSSFNGDMLNNIKRSFEEIGYRIMAGNNGQTYINALDFGVHQTRKRVILIGVRKDLTYRYPDLLNYVVSNNEDKTTKKAIDDLPILTAGKGKDFELMKYSRNINLSSYQKLMRGQCRGVVNHCARKHNRRDLEIYRLAIQLAENGEKLKYNDLPSKLKTHKNEKSFLDRYKVHNWDDVPHTIVAHIAKDGHYNIHPDIKQCRSLTVREAARIQSFPDDYIFEGPRTSQYTQVGNAVPPLMSEAIAKAIKKEYFMEE